MKNALELAKKLDRDLSVETWELAKVMGQLEQAIAETEQQEPEAWMHVRGDFKFPSRFLVEQNDVDAGWTGYALYTTPQPRKQLTDELEGQLLADKTYLRGMKAGYNLAMMNDGKNFNAAIAAYEKQIIEAAHGIKEKNT